MSERKKNLFNAAFVLIVFALTIYSVFAGKDLGDIAETITEAEPVYLLLGMGCVVLFIWGESKILHYMLDVYKRQLLYRTDLIVWNGLRAQPAVHSNGLL